MSRLPQHRSPPEHLRSTAPYNFVPLPERILPAPKAPFAAHDRLDPGRIHGEIELQIVTETEVYTRCAFDPAVDRERELGVLDAAEKQEFFHHGDPVRPVLPGASIRGMIRSLVEILSYSRLTRRGQPGSAARVRDEQLVHRAVADQDTPTGKAYAKRFGPPGPGGAIYFPGPDVRAGWLERDRATGSPMIHPARSIMGTTFVRVDARDLQALQVHADIRRGQIPQPQVRQVWVAPAAPTPRAPKRSGRPNLIYAKTARVTLAPGAGLEEAFIVPSGETPTRHLHTAVYARDGAAAPLSVDARLWEQFQLDQDMHRGLPCRVVKFGDPVFYLVESGKLTFLGPTLYFRVPYPRHTADYVPPSTIADAGPDPQSALDLAESIFGTVNAGDRGKDGGSVRGSHRGRVFFEDAPWVAGQPPPFLSDGSADDGRRCPEILSTPKPTSFQSYLVQKSTSGSDPKQLKRGLYSYAASTPDETVLRGFKQYWHRGSAADRMSRNRPAAHESQYTRIRPVRPGTKFSGRLRFENLLPVELGALLAALQLPGGCRHHIGMGKPLGMGSVGVTSTVRLFDPQARYGSWTSLGWLPAERTQAEVTAAQEEFRRAVVDHHNAGTTPRVDPRASLWDVPRLATLRILLDWDKRPDSRATAYGTDLKAFRDRFVLPTPQAVVGKPDPDVNAPLDDESPVSASGGGRTSAGSGQTQPRGASAVSEVAGAIEQFTSRGIRVRLRTESGSRIVTAPVSLDVFPLDAWGRISGAAIRAGTPVRVTMRGELILRVVPAPKEP